MSQFTKPLEVSPLPDGKRWRLLKSFEYHVGFEGSGHVITVPAGFVTDFASIPRLFWVHLPKWGKYGNAAVIHDWLYKRRPMSRKQADDIFLEAMGILKVSNVQRKLIYYAVRLFGWIAWRRRGHDR